jgi:quercetin dioxygenase-like cupin family protein
MHPVVKASIAGVTAAFAVAAWASLAQAQEIKRTEIKRSDLTGTNMEVIMTVLEAPPGAFLPKHIHYGEEAFYVLEGAMTEVSGQPATARAQGTGGINVREVPHAGYKVVGDKPLKLLTVHVVDKGKPLQVNVP